MPWCGHLQGCCPWATYTLASVASATQTLIELLNLNENLWASDFGIKKGLSFMSTKQNLESVRLQADCRRVAGSHQWEIRLCPSWRFAGAITSIALFVHKSPKTQQCVVGACSLCANRKKTFYFKQRKQWTRQAWIHFLLFWQSLRAAKPHESVFQSTVRLFRNEIASDQMVHFPFKNKGKSSCSWNSAANYSVTTSQLKTATYCILHQNTAMVPATLGNVGYPRLLLVIPSTGILSIIRRYLFLFL